MNRIIVFGATGGTGKEIVKQALEQGYAVTAVIRNPSSFDLVHEHLRIIKGDVLEPSTFEMEIQESDVVISCLGVRSSKPTKVYSVGLQNIIAVMNKAKVKRLICISAGALYVNDKMGVFTRLLTKIILQNILKNIYADMRLMEHLVEASALNWTIVRPPMLKDKPATGQYLIAIGTHVDRPFSIARADLAHFMITILQDPSTFKTKTEIAY